jgi:hypothetical protein
MRSRKQLMNEAMEACEFRGHRMNHWRAGEFFKSRRECECTRCGMGVMVDPTPPMNGIDIGGAAVAMNCGGISDAMREAADRHGIDLSDIAIRDMFKSLWYAKRDGVLDPRVEARQHDRMREALADFRV